MRTCTTRKPSARLCPAVFLDRDGTIIEDRGDLRYPSQVVFFSETVDALRTLQRCFSLFIVTNQPGVAKGTLTLEDAERINASVVSDLAQAVVEIVATYICPHRRTDGCACIKPNPYFLHQAAKEHVLDLRRSFVIGDHPYDVEFGKNAGVRGVYVLSGHGRKHRAELQHSDAVVSGILEAANWIMTQAKMIPVLTTGRRKKPDAEERHS